MTPPLEAAFLRIRADGEDPDALIEAVCSALADAARSAGVDTPDDQTPTRVTVEFLSIAGTSAFSGKNIALLLETLGPLYLSEVAGRPVQLLASSDTALAL